MLFCKLFVFLFMDDGSVYIEKLHRTGNRVVLVHCIDLPQLSLIKASKQTI